MELKREEVARLIDFIRNKIVGDTEFSSIIRINN